VPGADVVVAGGASRSASVRAGLAAVPDDVDVVVVHDGARPLASAGLLEAVVAAVRAGADAALPAVPVTDTVKRVGADGVVSATVERAGLVAVQTPQAFAAATLRRAHEGEPEATDDGALVEAIGGRVVVVPGETHNIKLTEPGDLATAERHLAAASSAAAPGPATRVGLGFDVHPYADDPARTLVLGGVTFPDDRGLAGHSDADAVAHAAIDALSGAAGLGDIGEHLPDTDPRWAAPDAVEHAPHGRPSGCASRLGAATWTALVVCERPSLAAARDEMQRSPGRGGRGHGHGKGRRPRWLGRARARGGHRCWAVAVVSRAQVRS
jgi:2-C-methyl-D-erythritol 2,4-cyclodiphosphate synthase